MHILYFYKDCNVEAMDTLLTKREDMYYLLKKNLRAAQHKMKQLANKKRSETEFNVGDWLYL
jgi:hypothetical protein